MVAVSQSGNYQMLLLNHLPPLMSSKNNFQMQAKPGLAVAGHGYVLVMTESYLSAQRQIRITQ